MIQPGSSCWKTEAQHYSEETCDTEEFKAPLRDALEGANYQTRKEYSVWGYSHSACVHMCVSVRVYVCVCMQRPEVSIKYLSQPLSTLLLKWDDSLDPELTKPAGQQVPASLLSRPWYC